MNKFDPVLFVAAVASRVTIENVSWPVALRDVAYDYDEIVAGWQRSQTALELNGDAKPRPTMRDFFAEPVSYRGVYRPLHEAPITRDSKVSITMTDEARAAMRTDEASYAGLTDTDAAEAFAAQFDEPCNLRVVALNAAVATMRRGSHCAILQSDNVLNAADQFLNWLNGETNNA